MRLRNLELKAWVKGCRVKGAGFRVQGSEFRVQASRNWVLECASRAAAKWARLRSALAARSASALSGFGVLGLGYGVWGLRFGVWGWNHSTLSSKKIKKKVEGTEPGAKSLGAARLLERRTTLLHLHLARIELRDNGGECVDPSFEQVHSRHQPRLLPLHNNVGNDSIQLA